MKSGQSCPIGCLPTAAVAGQTKKVRYPTGRHCERVGLAEGEGKRGEKCRCLEWKRGKGGLRVSEMCKKKGYEWEGPKRKQRHTGENGA